MNAAPVSIEAQRPVLRALLAPVELGTQERATLDAAVAGSWAVAPRREIVAAGTVAEEPLLILEGWGYRMHLLADGRRQIIQFLLPGDLISGSSGLPAPATVVALTRMVLCTAPKPGGRDTALEKAYATARARDQGYLFRQISRLGRLSAYERLLDWFCEMHERLFRTGNCSADAMTLPITQEVIADSLGLTTVHVNRTIQSLRRDGLIETSGRTVRLRNLRACRSAFEQRVPRDLSWQG